MALHTRTTPHCREGEMLLSTLALAAGAFQFWGRIQKPAIDTTFASATSILSLSKDAVLDRKRPFRVPSRFDRLCGSIQSKAEDSVTITGKFAPKVKCAEHGRRSI
jgi:hypothetical protein